MADRRDRSARYPLRARGRADRVAATPAALARPARNHRAGRSPLGFIPLFLASAALYLLALYSGRTEFLPVFGVLVIVNALGYWVSAARVIRAERRYRRARALRRGGVR